MKKQFVTYEIALKLKELGFDERCLALYKSIDKCLEYRKHYYRNKSLPYNKYSAPLWQQVIDWFWDNHKILITQYLVPDKTETIMWLVKSNVDDYYNTKEQAILKAIELCQPEK